MDKDPKKKARLEDLLKDLPSEEEILRRDSLRISEYVKSGGSEKEARDALQGRSDMVSGFVAVNQEMIETKDQDLLARTYGLLRKGVAVALLPPLIANRYLGKWTKEWIYYQPAWARIGIRSALFVLPAFIGYRMVWPTYTWVNLYIEEKYADRIVKFNKTGDEADINRELTGPPRKGRKGPPRS
jgi:hypothetical protein